MGASRDWISRTGRLQAVRAFIENNLAWNDLSPAKTAEALGISVRQLHMLFEPMETTFSRYVLNRRLERAQQILAADPDRKVIEVALTCGISSSTVFYRGFREAFGMNPSEYRRHRRASDHGQAPLQARAMDEQRVQETAKTG